MVKVPIEALTPSCIQDVVADYEARTGKDSFYTVLEMPRIDLTELSVNCLVQLILKPQFASTKLDYTNYEWNRATAVMVRNNLIKQFYHIITEINYTYSVRDYLGLERHPLISLSPEQTLSTEFNNETIGKIVNKKYMKKAEQTEVLKNVGNNGGRNILEQIVFKIYTL